MRAPRFWWRKPGLAEALLSPLGGIVGAVTLERMKKPGGTVPVPVICIGNPTVGGAGKTPTALAILSRLKARGDRPFALLRGHGGTATEAVEVDPVRHGPDLVGDEALLLARAAPTVVAGSDRLAGGRLAVTQGASHVVMDDGFQNPSLVKDLSILVVDAAVGVGNGAVLPAGPLRAPLKPQLQRADALLLIGDETAGAGPGQEVARMAQALGRMVLRGRLVPDPETLAALRGGPLYAFAGIGRPEKFFAMLEREGFTLAGRRAFADHHPFTLGEIEEMAAEAARQGARLVTTQKDAARLSGPLLAALGETVATVPVALVLEAPEDLDRLLDLATARARARVTP